MVVLLALMVSAALPIATVDAGSVVVLRDRSVLIGDVATLKGSPSIAASLKQLRIARLPVGRHHVTLSSAAVADLIRRAAPGLVVRTTDVGTIELVAPAGPSVMRKKAPGDSTGLEIAAAPSIKRGDRLFLVSKVGPITIDRPVTALQSSDAPAGKVFVRTGDGDVLVAETQILEGGAR